MPGTRAAPAAVDVVREMGGDLSRQPLAHVECRIKSIKRI